MYLEKEIEEISKRLDKLEKIIIHIIKNIQKEPIKHSENCKLKNKIIKESYNRYIICVCISDDANEMLELPYVPILTEEEINDATEKYKLKKKKERQRRKAKKSKVKR